MSFIDLTQDEPQPAQIHPQVLHERQADKTERQPSNNEGGRHRHFCFTYFPDGTDNLSSRDFYNNNKTWIRYLITGHEICPETHKYHWQGHLTTFNAVTQSGVIKKLKEALKKHCHVSVSVAPDASVKYCSKEGVYEEWGTKPNQGARSDVNSVVQSILDGLLTPTQVAITNPELFRQYHRSFEIAHIERSAKQKRTWQPEVIFITGPTGTGKTRYVHEEESKNEDQLYIYPYDNNGWWDTYTGQEAILFDDFRGQIPFTDLLRICDRYPYSLKRRSKPPFPILAKRIYITASVPIDDLYRDERFKGESLNQLKRRITLLVKTDYPDEPDPEGIQCGKVEFIKQPYKDEILNNRG